MDRQGAVPADQLDPRRAQIHENIRHFDVRALLRVLEELGYDRSEIRYRGNFTATPQAAWLDAIAFHDSSPVGSPRVTLKLNLGLLSCRSPLPSYFLELMQEVDVQEPLLELLGVLDERLLDGRVASYRSELDRDSFPDPDWAPRKAPSPAREMNATSATPFWSSTERDILSLCAMRSPSTLHWLFEKVFPDLRVSVRRVRQDRRLGAPGVRLGTAQLGSAALGAQAVVPVRDLEVTLVCDNRLSDLDEPADGQRASRAPWVLEVEKRLQERIFPLLRETGMHLAVVLLLLDQQAVARLDTRGSIEDRSYLGYDPVGPRRRATDTPARPGDPAKPLRVVLFSGPIPPAPPAPSPLRVLAT